MGQLLNLFPHHVPIGRADASGAVRMTPEFSRALTDVFSRLGGAAGDGTEDLAAEAAVSAPVPMGGPAGVPDAPVDALAARVAELAKMVEALQLELLEARLPVASAATDTREMELVIVPNYGAALAQLGTLAKQNADNVAITGGTINGTTIGATTRSTGRFTTVGVGTGAPAYRFVVSNGGGTGLEFDSDGAAYGAGTTAILAYDRAGAGYAPLFLDAASVLLYAAGNSRLTIDLSGVGFLGAATAPRQNVTGSREGNAALASLLTAAATFGLITDSTIP